MVNQTVTHIRIKHSHPRWRGKKNKQDGVANHALLEPLAAAIRPFSTCSPMSLGVLAKTERWLCCTRMSRKPTIQQAPSAPHPKRPCEGSKTLNKIHALCSCWSTRYSFYSLLVVHFSVQLHCMQPCPAACLEEVLLKYTQTSRHCSDQSNNQTHRGRLYSTLLILQKA